jgi:hypothetical protein
VTIYGFGGSVNTFDGEMPPGTPLQTCTNCHVVPTPYTFFPLTSSAGSTFSNAHVVPGVEGTTTYSGNAASRADDLTISPNAAVCSSCHDTKAATGHMHAMGASFSVLKDDVTY